MTDALLFLIVLALLPLLLAVLGAIGTAAGLGVFHGLRAIGLVLLVVGLPITLLAIFTAPLLQLAALFLGFWAAGKTWAILDPSVQGENE